MLHVEDFYLGMFVVVSNALRRGVVVVIKVRMNENERALRQMLRDSVPIP